MLAAVVFGCDVEVFCSGAAHVGESFGEHWQLLIAAKQRYFVPCGTGDGGAGWVDFFSFAAYLIDRVDALELLGRAGGEIWSIEGNNQWFGRAGGGSVGFQGVYCSAASIDQFDG